jgi:hypothetical protein
LTACKTSASNPMINNFSSSVKQRNDRNSSNDMLESFSLIKRQEDEYI